MTQGDLLVGIGPKEREGLDNAGRHTKVVD